jgi:phosphate transport system substrate-binding protein
MKKILLTLLLLFFSTNVQARENIRIVGSSTVFPFVTIVAEDFKNNTGLPSPIVESTGTGAGVKLFCAGVGENHPDIVNASRKIKDTELSECKKNGVKGITELIIGYDGIVLANSLKAPTFKLTKEQLFLAVAKKVPQNNNLVDNFYKSWSDISPELPNIKITVYGPPSTSGTRDAFEELLLEKACASFKEYATIKNSDERKSTCHQIRSDGAYIDSGENDNLIISKLGVNKNAVGIFGYSFLEENQDKIKAIALDGQNPTLENIQSFKYELARSLFVYVKNQHIAKIKGLKEFVKELTLDATLGNGGTLSKKGLIPLNAKTIKEVQSKASKI